MTSAQTNQFLTNWLLLTLFFFLISCNNRTDNIKNALIKAGKNSIELQKVLDHYSENKEKLSAAKFLVINMDGHFSYDTTRLYKYRVFYKEFDSINNLLDHSEFTNKMDSIWKQFQKTNSVRKDFYHRPYFFDNESITSSYLIKQIDLAFDIWKSNPVTKDSISFIDFCEYILPYRVSNGKSIENWRTNYISSRRKNTYPIEAYCDSILKDYQDYKFNWKIAHGLPILKSSDLKLIKEGKCHFRTWLNKMVLSANGIPTAIDFVPAWGSREGQHQWNSVIYNGKTYPFEPFWRPDIWKNKTIYNNIGIDDKYGKHRVPKVFREMYSTHLTGPITNNKVSKGNIPKLFLNPKIKDVSTEYFYPTNIDINLRKIPNETYYAYLCVIGESQKWIPVYWGEINGSKVTFTNMGTDITYLPAYFKNGKVIPASDPFHISKNGQKTIFKTKGTHEKIILTRKYPLQELYLDKLASNLNGSIIQGSNNRQFTDADTIFTIDFQPRLIPNTIKINSKKSYRYYRIISGSKIQLGELKFNTKNATTGTSTPIRGNYIGSKQMEDNSLTYLNDNNVYTTNKYINEDFISHNPYWIGLEADNKSYLNSIEFTPKTDTNDVFPNLTYRLIFWNGKEFETIEEKEATDNLISFKHVPKNSLLVLKCLDQGKQERIFTYQNGKQIWW